MDRLYLYVQFNKIAIILQENLSKTLKTTQFRFIFVAHGYEQNKFET